MMTEEEVARLLALLMAHFQKELSNEEVMVKTWQMALGDVTYPIAEKAVAEWMRIGKEFPTSAHIRELCVEVVDPSLTADEAWGQVMKTALRVPHNQIPDLPPATMKALDACGGWRRVVLADLEKVDMRKHFIFAYKGIQEKGKVFRDLSPLTGAGEPALPEGSEDRLQEIEAMVGEVSRTKRIGSGNG
jgi:hypothetical protein